MRTKLAEPNTARHRGRRSHYRIANHHEAGIFDSMTGATVWALKNLHDLDWRIEPVSGSIPMERRRLRIEKSTTAQP
jgi:hypothetical protein